MLLRVVVSRSPLRWRSQRLPKEIVVRGSFHATSRIPPSAHLAANALKRHDYADSYSLPLPPSAPSVDRIIIQLLSDFPSWVAALDRLRDRLVRVFGLRTADPSELTGHSELPLRPGGRVGFFPVIARDTDDAHDELLLGQDDKHLDFCVSALCARDAEGRRRFAVTTVVEIHNLPGRLYFATIKPFHRLILRSSMRRLADALESGVLGESAETTAV
jgi:hypothetical protein